MNCPNLNFSDEPRQDYVLFDEMRGRYLFRQQLTMTEAVEWTVRLKKSFCPNLKWQKTSAEAIRALDGKAKDINKSDFQKQRVYVLRKN